VGTAGAVKGLLPEQIRALGSEMILANTYHFMLRPGVDVVERLGGLHRFMAWDGPILTDSGGYQIFSLSDLTRIDDQGVHFASHLDGARIDLDAETAVQIQNRLGADVIMCLDQCTPYPVEKADLDRAVDRTIRWAARCRQAHRRTDQMLFGIVQGGTDLAVRAACADALQEIGFEGYAIGGLSVGEGHDLMIRTVEHTAGLLDPGKPRYLMGAGMPADIVAAVRSGVDMFDCVLPTRNGRNAYAFTAGGPLRMRNSIHAEDPAPIEAGCDCYACRHYTRATIRHFCNCGEMLGSILLSMHNIRFYQRLMAQIRDAIERDLFATWSAEALGHYRSV
ncbi:MAG: tRNA guanosine(34) transglycosylase Tgt, partial [Phycisphaerae bacterium]|nr:tRNA guanosine(34) transglycosylase Tgt [Phycisphaerae bacterium]